MTVNNVNDDPTVDSGISNQSAVEGQLFNFAVPLNAFDDVDGDSLTLSASGLPSWLSFDGTTFTGTPDSGDVGTTSITVTATDGNGGTDATTTFDLVVVAASTNTPPVAADDQITTDEDIAFIGNLLADNGNGTDSDADGDPLKTYLLTTPADGSVTVAEDGSFTYTPDSNFNGTDSFTYLLLDDAGGSDSATVSITVDAVNDAPVIASQTLDVDENSAAGTVVGTVVASDPDVGQVLTYTFDTPPAEFDIDPSTGEITVAAGAILDADVAPTSYNLTVTVTDNGSPSESTSATVTIDLNDITDEDGPRINAVRVNSTAWSDLFRDYVDYDEGATPDMFDAYRFDDGDDAGYEIPFGASQSATLPWINLNQIIVDFDEDVIGVDISDFVLSGTAGVNADATTGTIPTIIAVDYITADKRAIITLNESVEAAILDLKIISSGITDATGNPLNGDWENGVTTGQSGDATAGGDFEFEIRVLPGDVDKSSFETVNITDEDAIKDGSVQNTQLFEFGGNKGAFPGYDPTFDVNGSGNVNNDDTRAVQDRIVSDLVQPAPPAMMSFAPASGATHDKHETIDLVLEQLVSTPSSNEPFIESWSDHNETTPTGVDSALDSMFDSESSTEEYADSVDKLLSHDSQS